MNLTPKQYRQIEELYFGLTQGKENLADAHRRSDEGDVAHYKEYVALTSKQLEQLLPNDLSKEVKGVLKQEFERLYKFANSEGVSSTLYQRYERRINEFLPGFSERNGTKTTLRKNPGAEPAVVHTDLSERPIASNDNQSAIEPKQGIPIADGSGKDTTRMQQFVALLDDVRKKAELIKTLHKEIKAESGSEIYELNQLKGQPRIDKASKSEYKKRMRNHRRNHNGYVSGKIGLIIMLMIGAFIAPLLALTPALTTERILRDSKKAMPGLLADYALNYNKDFIIWTSGGDVNSLAYIGYEDVITKGEITEGRDHRPAASTIAMLVAILALSLWVGHTTGKKISLLGIAADGYAEFSQIPLYTPGNKARQKEIDKIAKELSKQIRILIKEANSLLRSEFQKNQWNEDLINKISIIDKFGKLVRGLTLKRLIRAERLKDVGSGGAKEVLALIGGVLLACVAIAAVVSLPREHIVTWSDGSITHEWY